MSPRLEGKIAVVTGGTEGIGLATAKLFVDEGAYVFITGRRQKELDEAVKAIGTNVSGVQGDVAQLADLDRLYESVSKVKGRIDIVFANAGFGEFVPFGAVTEEHFDKLFNINVRGTLFTVQKALPLLNDGGSIILNGSVASVKGTAAFGVYAASKAAIRSFVRTWTTDLKDRRIRSNVVSPGPINTPLASRQSADVIARIVSTIPMGPMGEPEEVAKVALFLASDDSSFVTGIELFVDGGSPGLIKRSGDWAVASEKEQRYAVRERHNVLKTRVPIGCPRNRSRNGLDLVNPGWRSPFDVRTIRQKYRQLRTCNQEYIPDVGGVPGAEHTRYRARCASRRNSAAVATDFVNADFWGARRRPGRHSYYGRAVARPRESGGGEGQESDDDLRHAWPRRSFLWDQYSSRAISRCPFRRTAGGDQGDAAAS